jgi:hypothetical protein
MGGCIVDVPLGRTCELVRAEQNRSSREVRWLQFWTERVRVWAAERLPEALMSWRTAPTTIVRGG